MASLSVPSQSAEPQRSPRRLLACSSCQQRKVKCDRKSPCANCTKSGTPCVPAAPVARRRRFPERALLERLRKYEGLLHKHSIKFEPLHSHSTQSTEGSSRVEGTYTSDEDEGQLHAPLNQTSSSSFSATRRTESDWPKYASMLRQ
jgi:hypothetical protein